MSIEQVELKHIIEGAIMAAEQPLSLQQIANLFAEDVELQPTNNDILAAITLLQEDYANRGVELKQIASGYRFQARAELGKWICKMWEDKPQRYSRAFLETLAIVAYRQPITRAEIEEIRGVVVNSHIVKTLMERGWIREVGHKDLPGRPALLATTREFLDYFNLKSLNELPSLIELQEIENIEQLGQQLELQMEVEAQAEVEAETEVEARAESEVEFETEVEARAESEVEFETEIEAQTESEVEFETEVEAQAESEVEAETEVETHAETTDEATEFDRETEEHITDEVITEEII